MNKEKIKKKLVKLLLLIKYLPAEGLDEAIEDLERITKFYQK